MSQNLVDSFMKFGAGGAGMTDAFIMGGNESGTRQLTCLEYDGSSWTSGGSLGEARETGSGIGDTTNARYVNGYTIVPTPYPNSNDNDEYNGTSWSADTVCPTTTNNMLDHHVGTVDSCRFVGGHSNGIGNITRNDEWDGTSWSTATTQVLSDNTSGNGTQDDLLVQNGGTGTYTFDGTSWSASHTINVNRKYSAGSGGTSNCILCGSNVIAQKDTTSVYDGSSWSVGASMVTGTPNPPTAASPDNNTSMMICGGVSLPSWTYDLTGCEELVDGVFSAVASLTTGRGNSGCGGISL